MDMTKLAEIIPPHAPNEPEKLASLIAAYDANHDVPPVVALDFGDRVCALAGSHRIAAARETYEEDADVEECLGWIIVDGNAVYEQADDYTQRQLDALQIGQAGDYSELCAKLAPLLPAEARSAIEGQ